MGTRAEGRDSIGNMTMTGDSINITGHTSQIQAISHLGSDPDQWLLALRGLEELENGPRKRKLLKHFFAQSGKILDSASLRKSRSYAVLLGKEALFYGEIDVHDARRTFQMGLSMCQNVPVLYVMFAQFELDQGRKEKALKVLKHGQVCVENPSEIIAAKAKLEQGFTRIDGSKEKHDPLPLKNITNDVKTHPISVNNRKADTAYQKRVEISGTQKSVNPSSSQPLQVSIPLSQAAEDQPRFTFPTATKNPLAASLSSNLQPVPECRKQVQVEKISTINYNPTTPLANRIAELKSHDLGLMDSPASPNITFELSTQHNTELYSEKCSNTTIGTQKDILSSVNHSNPHDALSKSYMPPKSSAMSERKSSPTSLLMQQRCQTTGKKPTRVATSNAPRRVLMKGVKSQLNDSESDDDIRPIQKSPDDVNVPVFSENEENQIPNSSVQQNHVAPKSFTSSQSVPVSVSPNIAVTKAPNSSQPELPLKHVSAFKPYPKPDCHSHPIQSMHSTTQDPPIPKPLHSTCPNERSQALSGIPSHSVVANKENVSPHLISAPSSVHHSTVNKENASPHCAQVPQSDQSLQNMSGMHSHNPSDPSSLFPTQSLPYQPDLHTTAQSRQVLPPLHPAHRLIMDKKVIEVNGTPYILLKLLGKGGSSKVYQVLDPKTSTIAAVKQVNLVGCERSVLDGYKNEINFLKKLQGNRYIIKLIDYEIRERHLYLVMECGSLDLSAFLKKQKSLGEDLEMIDILAFWKNMLRAVEAIHKHGVIHLDLKPANFMLIDYTLKLIDFGIANSIQVDATSIIKDTQFGTLNYMAPETINDLSGDAQCGSVYEPRFKVGPKADVWSLGCILYYIMYGKTPFQHIHHQMKKFIAITNENHRIDFPDFPRRELIEIVKACLIRDPKKRPSVEILLNHPLLK